MQPRHPMHFQATNAAATAIGTPDRSNNAAVAPAQSAQRPALTRDFHPDTFFNPTWMPGPNVFSFAKDGTVIHSEPYRSRLYPAHHPNDVSLRPEPATVPRVPRGDPKPWKNVAITEQDDLEAKWAAFKEKMRVGDLGENRQRVPDMPVQHPAPEGPELVYTWPPRPNGF